MRVKIQDVSIDIIALPKILEQVINWINSQKSSYHIVTLNALMVIMSGRDQAFKDLLTKADLVIVDSYGIEAALHKQGLSMVPRVAGVDLARGILAWCARSGTKIYCYGGPPDLPDRLRAALKKQWPDLVIGGIRDGFNVNASRKQVIAEIHSVKPGVLLVGLGVPKQEQFLAEVLPGLQGTVGIGVGGALEIIAGWRREAPGVLRKYGWEWLFRMIQEPIRFKYLPDLVVFWLQNLISSKKRGEKDD